MIKNKTQFDPGKMEIDQERQKRKQIARLEKETIKHGYILQKAA